MSAINNQTGIVIIGRNEGPRLQRCLQSILCQVDKIVYVDSDSSDNSISYANSLDVDVVQLDMNIPLSAGRARNEGFWHIINKYPRLRFVQFIDGDCELCEGWYISAFEYLVNHTTCAIVAGQVKERFPEKSIYNLLCDLEWDTPHGEVKSCGGIFMVRKNIFIAEGGFNPKVIAGEEPEFCYRIREKGWKIYKLDHLMALHDAAMTSFSQWGVRAIRSGFGYAQGFALHGRGSEKYYKDSKRIWFWALIVPFLIIFSAKWFSSWALLSFIVYPIQIIRIAKNINRKLTNWNHSLYYAFFNVIGKWPQLCGQLIFIAKKISRKSLSIIEYK